MVRDDASISPGPMGGFGTESTSGGVEVGRVDRGGFEGGWVEGGSGGCGGE